MTASAGAVNPIIIIKAIESIAKAIGKVFGFLEVREKNKRKMKWINKYVPPRLYEGLMHVRINLCEPS